MKEYEDYTNRTGDIVISIFNFFYSSKTNDLKNISKNVMHRIQSKFGKN